MLKIRLKLMVLRELEREAQSGYSLMTKLEELIGKRPSPGYLYPLLHDLHKSKLVSVRKEQRRKVYTITADGKKYLADLVEKHRKCITAIGQVFEHLGEKKAATHLFDIRNPAFNHMIVQDISLLNRLRTTIIKTYEKSDPKNRMQLRSILKSTIRQLEKIQ